jgi:hypothetical protein
VTRFRDAHPRLLVDDLADLRARCTGALSHQCDQNAMFAGSDHLTNPVGGYSESELARIAKVMAFQYLMTSQQVHADRVREVLLQLSSYNRQHWVDLRDQVQDLGLGWIGLSWMLALDWAFEDLRNHPADLQTIADGTCVFVDYLLEMYKHVDFNNHFYLGRSPVLLAGLLLHGEGVRDADALRYLAEGFDFLFNHEHPALNVVAGEMGGWHESLGYFDGEMGMPMAVDMDGLRTATGLDFFQDSSFWRTLSFWYLSSTVPWDRTIIHWADQGRDRWSRALDGSESEGKGVRQYLTAVHKNLRRLGYPEAEQAQELLDNYIGVFYDSGTYAESYYKVAHMNDVLWYQPGAPAGGLAAGRQSYHFDSLGEVILREGNQTDDAMAMFACADFRGGHQQADNGHFSIWYQGYLAVDSGYYDGWGSSHHMNYARRTIAHNTLTVTMPGESFTNTSHNDGGQHVPERPDRPLLRLHRGRLHRVVRSGQGEPGHPRVRVDAAGSLRGLRPGEQHRRVLPQALPAPRPGALYRRRRHLARGPRPGAAVRASALARLGPGGPGGRERARVGGRGDQLPALAWRRVRRHPPPGGLPADGGNVR